MSGNNHDPTPLQLAIFTFLKAEQKRKSQLCTTKVDGFVENLTCVGKSSGFSPFCCESCLNSVGATAATTQNRTCFDTCFKKDLQAAHVYIFLLFTKFL
jgi:hypothetical protein